jgi:hypothetical protein
VFGALTLIRFIGCNWFFDIRETEIGPSPPVFNVEARAGDQSVDVSWIYFPGQALSFKVVYGTTSGVYTDEVTVASGSNPLYSVMITGLTNGVTYYFVVTGDASGGNTIADSPEVSATPGVTSFVQTVALGVALNDFTGLKGMAITMGPADVIVTQLGRIVGPANVQAHVVKIVEAGPGGTEIASVSIQMPAGPVGTFAFATLAPPVTLQAFRQYFIVSHEQAGGDFYHDLCNVTTTPIASITSGISRDDMAPGFSPKGGLNQSYVPVNFKY